MTIIISTTSRWCREMLATGQKFIAWELGYRRSSRGWASSKCRTSIETLISSPVEGAQPGVHHVTRSTCLLVDEPLSSYGTTEGLRTCAEADSIQLAFALFLSASRTLMATRLTFLPSSWVNSATTPTRRLSSSMVSDRDCLSYLMTH